MLQMINRYQGSGQQIIPKQKINKREALDINWSEEECGTCPQSPVKLRMLSIASTLQELYHFVDETSSLRVVSFSLKSKASVKNIQMIDVTQIKLGLLSSISNNLKSILERMNKLDLNKNDFNNTLLGNEYKALEIKVIMQKILLETSQFLINKHSKKQIYRLITFQWKQETQTKFSNLYFSKQKQFISKKMVTANFEDTIKHIPRRIVNPIEQQILQFKKDYEQRISNKQKQLQKWTECCYQMEQIIQNQCSLLELKQKQIQGLQAQNYIYRINQELYEEKYAKIQAVLYEITSEISNIKVQTQKQAYYMNPLWDKNLTEEKYFVEIIQLQSDLLIARNQIASLTDAIISIIDLTQSSFDELRASPRFVGGINGQIFRILREQRSFEGIDLDQILGAKQQCCFSTAGSQSLTFTEMKRSGISTFSEIEDGQKLFSTYCDIQECLNMDAVQ